MANQGATQEQRIRFAQCLMIICGVLLCALVVDVLTAPASGQPPTIEKALDDFTGRYSQAAVNEVRITQDEVSARTFEIEYRNKASGNMGKLALHYVNRGNGKWDVQPEPPAQLP